MSGELYAEVQRFRGPIVWTGAAVAALVGWWALLSEAIHLLPRPPRWPGFNWPDSRREAAFVWALAGVLVPLLLILARLRVTVGGGGIHIRLFPLMRRRVIRFEEVTSVVSRRYAPIKEFGGWGIKGTRADRAYNMSGNHGVELTLSNGRHVMIGSRTSDQLAAAIERGRSS